jgi:peptidyl-prolyl cis-trans isomerase C
MNLLRSFLLLIPVVCVQAQAPSQPTPAPKPAAPAARPAAPVPDDKVVVTIGEEKITAGELNRVIASLPEQYRTAANGTGRKQFLENLVRVKVLAQEARRRKLDQDPTYLGQLSMQQDNLLASTAYNHLAQSVPVTQELVTQYYNQHKAEFESARPSHILIRFKGSAAPVRPGMKELTETEALAKAQAVRKELLGGADFATVARRDSDDAGSGVQGGDLGVIRRGQMMPTFEEAAFSLKVGQVSEPVKTMYGYHIIKVSQREAKTIEQARADIEKKLRPEAAMKMVEALQKSTNIVIDPQYAGEEKK